MRSHRLCWILGSISIVLLAGAAADAAVYYVALDGSGKDGQSWASAYKSIKTTVEAAVAGDEIRVKQGTYGTDFTIYVDEAVKIYGGYSGVGDERNPGGFVTIVNGLNSATHCFNVSANATISGFTITKGRAYGTEPSERGGGMYIHDCAPTIRDCVFYRNIASDYGGGLALDNAGGAVIRDCSFVENSAPQWGGGIFCHLSDATIWNCHFEGNKTGYEDPDGYGAGIYTHTCSPTISNCTFTDNGADYGSGICNFASNARIERCTFTDPDPACRVGGAIYNLAGAPIISECLFESNRVTHRGGAVFDRSLSTFINCIFWNNSGMTNGGAVYVDAPTADAASAAKFINCTMYGNTASTGSALYSNNAAPTMTNCIVWGNTSWDEEAPDQIYSLTYTFNQKTVASYCDIGGDTTYPGTGNIRVDPQFVDAPGGDFSLQGSSPCIDAGTNSVANLPQTDYADNPRIRDGNEDGLAIVDMGAHEMQGYTPTEHVYRGEILQAMVYENPADTTADYTFMMEFQTDGTIDHIDFRTPAGNVFTIPNTAHTSSGNVETHHVEWPAPVGHIWQYWAKFDNAAGLNSYGDGAYTITYYRVGGSSLQAMVAYNLDGGVPIPMPTQKPNVTSPEYGASVGAPVTLTWDACTDTNANSVFLTIINADTDAGVVTDVFAKSATASNGYTLADGVYDVEMSFASLYDTADGIGTPFEVGKVVMVGHQFEVIFATVYRFWSPVNSVHFYTISEQERDGLIANWGHVWTFEGPAYHTAGGPGQEGLMPVYRFWSPVNSVHFYTISEQEKDALVADWSHVWTLEGIAFYAYPEGQQPAESKPVYRFWSPVNSVHFYTISEQEKDALVADWSHVWTLEGIAYYAYE